MTTVFSIFFSLAWLELLRGNPFPLIATGLVAAIASGGAVPQANDDED